VQDHISVCFYWQVDASFSILCERYE